MRDGGLHSAHHDAALTGRPTTSSRHGESPPETGRAVVPRSWPGWLTRSGDAGPARGPHTVVILGIVLLGFSLRVLSLGDQSLWYDEAYTILLSLRSLPDIVGGTAQDTLPPLYYVVLHLWSMLGQGDFWWRFPPAGFGALAIPLAFTVGKRLFAPAVGLGGALFLALSPFQVFFSQEARMYPFLTVLSLLMVYGFARGSQTGSHRAWLLVTVSGAVAVYTHSLAWFLLASLLAFRLIQQRAAVVRRPDMILAILIVGLTYLPWAGIFVQQARLVQGSFWAGAPTPVSPFASLYLFVFGPFLPPWQMALGMAAVLLTLGLGLAAMRSRWKTSDVRPALALTLVWLWGPLALAFAASQIQPIYLERTLIGSSPALFLLVAWGLLSLRPRVVAWGLGGLIAALLLAALNHALFDSAHSRPPYRAVAEAVRTGWQAGDGVLHTGDGSYLPFLLYLPDLPQHLLAGDPEHLAGTSRAQSTLRVMGAVPVSGEQAAAGHARMWLVVAPDHSIDFQQGAAQDFGSGRTLLQDQNFNGIGLSLFQ